MAKEERGIEFLAGCPFGLGVLIFWDFGAANQPQRCTFLMIRTPLLITFLLFFKFFEVQGQKSAAAPNLSLSNPGLFYGTDFGNYFQRLYINQDYDRMLSYTSKQSRKKYGDIQLLDYYRSIDFAFPLELKSKSVQGDTIWLNYITNIQATKRMVRVPVVVERDTVRMVILSVKIKSFLID